VSIREIARRTGRCPRTVARVPTSPDVERVRAQARDALDLHLPRFAADFMKASKVGALRGRREPAFDVLLSLAVMEKPRNENVPRVVVNIGVMPGQPGGSLSEIVLLERDSHGRPQRQTLSREEESES
jgi:hypothetical protein